MYKHYTKRTHGKKGIGLHLNADDYKIHGEVHRDTQSDEYMYAPSGAEGAAGGGGRGIAAVSSAVFGLRASFKLAAKSRKCRDTTYALKGHTSACFRSTASRGAMSSALPRRRRT